ncbi:Hpt domain-containing protein [Sphingomonas flavalba]|uniref:Hpt domain-containing protein n=1 Tax=Sphingomonas flavalba TaxID=2559804 RepID=UPI0039E18F25
MAVYDPGALDAALAAAVGDDPTLVAELRSAFMDSAAAHIDAMSNARNPADWQAAAYRLKGLAASFGATRLMDVAEQAATAPAGDAEAIRTATRAISRFGN